MRAVDWVGRVLLMVLSGTATLSLIGAIVETTDTGPMPASAPVVIEAGRVSTPPTDARIVRTPVPIEPGVVPIDREHVRWLRALTYAVTALAGFAAAAVVVLLRITATLDRIARR